MNTLLDIFVLPLLGNIGLYNPPDPTHGRYLLEKSPYETKLEADPDIKVSSRRVFLDSGKGEAIHLTREELDASIGKEWVYYKTWEKENGKDCDILMLHGINDYGGKWASHVPGLLEKGFRIIAPDLPSHGRSTGLHAYIETPDQFVTSVEAVLRDVETLSDRRKKTFVVGFSLGGGIALNYCARNPDQQRIAGVFGIAPMIGISPETMPSRIVFLAARILRFFAGRLPFAPAVRGNISDDPRVEEEFFADPRCYHGDIRISTGLALILCLSYLTPSAAASFSTPFHIIHGDHDRATSHHHSVQFFEAAGSQDKELEIYEGCEHVILKVGVDEKDDEQRQRALRVLGAWVLHRS